MNKTKNILILSMILILGISLTANAQYIPSNNKALIQTNIINYDTNEPVKNAKVNIGDKIATSDKNGFVELKGLSKGQHKIMVYKAGYEDKNKDITIDSYKKDLSNIKIRELNPNKIKGTYVKGNIKDEKTGKTIKSARVKLGNRYVLSNNKGVFKILDLNPLDYDSLYIEVSKEGYKKKSKVIELDKGKNDYGNIYLRKIIDEEKENGFEFDNSYLSRKITQKLEIDDITKTDLTKVKMLSLQPNIKGNFNLSALKHMSNLKNLRIKNGGIINNFNLSKLKNLKRLEIKNSKIQSLKFLPRNLEQLIITDCDLKDFSSLKRLKSINLKLLTLKGGNLSNNKEAIHRAIQDLNSLDRLTLNNINLDNISFIKEINPYYFNVADNNIESLKPFFRLNNSKIEILNLNNNRIKHIHQLEDLKLLEQVDLRNNNISFKAQHHWNEYARIELKERGVQTLLD